MKIGPKEKQILRALIPGEFIPPSVYLGDYGSCPTCYTTNRIVFKKELAQFRYATLTPAERLAVKDKYKPGKEASEFFAALILTKKGEEILASMKRRPAPERPAAPGCAVKRSRGAQRIKNDF
jgi:hypothetical protein